MSSSIVAAKRRWWPISDRPIRTFIITFHPGYGKRKDVPLLTKLPHFEAKDEQDGIWIHHWCRWLTDTKCIFAGPYAIAMINDIPKHKIEGFKEIKCPDTK